MISIRSFSTVLLTGSSIAPLKVRQNPMRHRRHRCERSMYIPQDILFSLPLPALSEERHERKLARARPDTAGRVAGHV